MAMDASGHDMGTVVVFGTNSRSGSVTRDGRSAPWQSDTLDEAHMRPAIFHGFLGQQASVSRTPQGASSAGYCMMTSLETLLGIDAFTIVAINTKLQVCSRFLENTPNARVLTEVQIPAWRLLHLQVVQPCCFFSPSPSVLNCKILSEGPFWRGCTSAASCMETRS